MISEWLEISCTVIGFLVCLGVVVAFLSILLSYAVEKIGKAVWKYKRKHRFNKKPIAKCYCIDCFYYKDNCEINKTGRCLRLERIVADDGFCKDAFPYREGDCK